MAVVGVVLPCEGEVIIVQTFFVFVIFVLMLESKNFWRKKIS